jgi:molybdopterin-guanine dinucleotide biosynthesis protein A
MGQDKGLMKYRGLPMVQHAINSLQPFCNELMISSNQDGYQQFGLRVVPDLIPGKGPLGGICAAMACSASKWSLVVACDMPFLQPEAIELLVSSISSHQAYVAGYGNRVEPLFAIYSASALSKLQNLLHEDCLKMQEVVKHLDAQIIDFSAYVDAHPLIFSNFNRPDDVSK